MMVELAIANVVALALAVTWLASLTLPVGNLVRARNAFLLRRGQLSDFTWTPPAIPPEFRVERMKAPAVIMAAVESAGIGRTEGDWSRALALVGFLVRDARHEGGIQADLASTYCRIKEGYGYCADFVRVYLAAAGGVGLFCRQWAFSFDGFGGHGHTFVEIYDRQRGAWSFVDVHNNVYAVLAGTQVPIDGLTLRHALLRSPSSIEFRQAASGRLGFPNFDKLVDYYRRGARAWYLWWGNDVVSREQTVLARAVGMVSGRLSYRVVSTVGRLPWLVVIATSDNAADVARMERLRRRLTAALVTSGILAVSLGLELTWLLIEIGRG